MKYTIQITTEQEFKHGMWYKSLTHEGSYVKYRRQDGTMLIGIGVTHTGTWRENGAWSAYKSYRPATKEEIKTILITEAKKRGFKGGISNLKMRSNSGTISEPGSFTGKGDLFGYHPTIDLLEYWGVEIYRNGEWTKEVI